MYVVNDNTTPYDKITDMNVLLTDSTGSSMSGKYFSLVVWGCVSESTGDCKLFVNLPAGSYLSQSSVEQDTSKYADFSIPIDFRGTGFLISEFKLRHQVISGGTWTSIEEVDLRGTSPDIQAGSGTAGNQNLYQTFTGDTGSSTADSTTDSMAVVGGNLLTTTVTDDQISIAAEAAVTGATKNQFGITVDGGGSVLTASEKNAVWEAKNAGTLSKVSIYSRKDGAALNATVDVILKKNGTDMTNSNPVQLTGAISEAHETVFTGWTTTSFVAGDEITLEITGTPATIEYLTTLGHYSTTGA
jgi:hypothetical protein